jgi:hypothetical protein
LGLLVAQGARDRREGARHNKRRRGALGILFFDRWAKLGKCPRASDKIRRSALGYNRSVTRLRRIADRDRIFFVKANLHRRAPRLSGAERDLLLNQLGRQHAANQFLIFAYVIMPTHFHLLIAPRLVILTLYCAG